MKTTDFDYNLPEELIAQTPIEPRDSSRLLVYDKNSGSVDHRIFRDLTSFLNAGDVLAVNNTKVLPARLKGTLNGVTNAEVLLLKRLDERIHECIVRPAKRARLGSEFIFAEGELKAVVKEIGQEGIRVLEFEYKGVFEEVLYRVGQTPLPGYIKQELKDIARYQTVYSKVEGSAAAPTAGLHFTERLLDELKAKGVIIAEVLLHVGLGTFRPVSAENITEHVMHKEYYEVDEATAKIINQAKQRGSKIVAVGTTTVRTLESVACEDGTVRADSGETGIFIYPPYKYKTVDAIITNFHLPKSTLIMLVSAFCGLENTLNAYKAAVEREYRFFSFGDAMVIL
jgi:S-adenosylmethionine:tRNA ribosyltransferase-isomerase